MAKQRGGEAIYLSYPRLHPSLRVSAAQLSLSTFIKNLTSIKINVGITDRYESSFLMSHSRLKRKGGGGSISFRVG